ncbi:hypothetical protein Taro_055749 [Colocasia esculenta]|uniref:Uncharacterized protein n=1 Tax=Colocasia esculenta TaxID=4460 RepID=A0A843XU78_COLES|nr:hypothetical protein [Colocasia esculenta]
MLEKMKMRKGSPVECGARSACAVSCLPSLSGSCAHALLPSFSFAFCSLPSHAECWAGMGDWLVGYVGGIKNGRPCGEI